MEILKQMKYSTKTIKEQAEKGKKMKYLMFWGHQPSKDGSITASCFSQWWVSKFEVNGNTFRSAEHWMMWEKANLFEDVDIAKQILECKSPAQAKAFGRKVTGFQPEVWDAHKYEIVKKGSYHKFSQNDELKEFLLNTRKRVLVEASPVDPVWGIGMAKDHLHAEIPSKWRGEILLGIALMEVRDELS